MTPSNYPEKNDAAEMHPTNLQNTNTSRKSRSKTRTGLKMLLIAGICLTFLIPQAIIKHSVEERQQTRNEAQHELGKSWGREQHVSGPVIVIPGYESSTPKIVVCPESLNVSADVKTETLKRGIYHFNTYSGTVKMKGKFNCPEKIRQEDLEAYNLDGAYVLLKITDLRGLADDVKIHWGNETLIPVGAMSSGSTKISGLSADIDFQELLTSGQVAFSIDIPLKGTNGLYFTPVGNSNKVTIKSDYNSPSFQGDFLPYSRSVGKDGFTAQWSVLALNRSFGQVTTLPELMDRDSGESELGVEFCIPVDQYQQSMRAIKYALLIVVLTFAVVFFVEIRRKTRIHPIQYVLVGIAIILFYTLLLSLSEHIAFLLSYIISAIVTIGCVTVYLSAIIRSWKTALAIGGGLALLYTFIFVLLQLENYALLAGSIGLFCILGAAMYASQKIKWYGED